MPKRPRATRALLPTLHVHATALAAGVTLLATGCRPSSPSGTPSPATGAEVRVPNAPPAALGADEARLRDAVRARYDDAVALLARAVDMPSGTHNVAGVRRVGELFATELRAIGFETRWESLPDGMRRAGHLVAEHRGTRGPRLLLIGHLDTVFEGENQRWVRDDSVARGAGTTDMKGGDVAMLLALRALADAGQLADMHVTVVMTGDEELPARPLSVARAALVDAARRSDLALAFEGGSATRFAIGRRGTSQWTLRVRGRQGHSSGIFSQGAGYGAVYEGARVIDEWRRAMVGERGLTFSVGLVGGGERVQLDSTGNALAASGKDNIIPPTFVASGDLRFLRDAQRDSARARMQAIVARSLPGTSAELTFEEGYPAMAVTPENERLLAIFDGASRALGYPAVETTPPENRGAGDVSFVAPYIPGIDGLGTDGRGSHSPEESVSLPSLRMAAERAAVFMARLAREWPRRSM
jgi:glutamate carboxypeptidase